ncbi:sensor histidine kinase [Anaeromyxobacter paludicola]|uniref:Histidine kinase n=1 Tax=Anaeromyxobacter paludicola TaxID=2918171 RepID=A0ABN6NEA4_9BACT|nr:sensor histidine kinase [Anaeromyxobacter paludicola]BDG10831.1 hypothetical protein AMPC_39440 [Anaeromyxobacter paludicola]
MLHELRREDAHTGPGRRSAPGTGGGSRRGSERRRRLQAREDERSRISRELHDTTAQNLSAAVLGLSRALGVLGDGAGPAAPILVDALALCSASLEEVRTLSYQLRPPLLEEGGLGPALEWYAGVFSRRSGIPVELTLPREARRLPRALESALFRIAQEALSNAQRHSGCARVALRLAVEERAARLEIEDDGPAASGLQLVSGARPPGKGLQGMRERARAVGGRLALERPAGLLVRVVVPRRRCARAPDPAGR